MRNKFKGPFVILFFLALMASSGYSQIKCTVIRERTQTPPIFGMSGKLENTKTWIFEDKIRRDDGRGSSKIIRLDKGLMWIVNNRDSSYTELSKDEFQGMAVMALMMYGITFDTLTGKVIIPDPLFKKTGKRGEVNGYKCFEVVPTKMSQKSSFIKGITMWISPDTGLEPELFADILKKTLGGMGDDYNSFFKQIEELGGYPVRIETKALGRVVTQDFQGYQKETVPANFFNIPDGYKKKEGFFGPL